MLNCLICGKNAIGGWTAGLPPAPDSQKVGLCLEHDTPDNRNLAEKKWREIMGLAVEIEQKNDIHIGGTRALPMSLEILFIDGGRIEVLCKSFRNTDGDVLEITTPENRLVFYPLRHIRRYGKK